MDKSFFQNNLHLRSILDALPSAVFVVDSNFNIFDMNPAAAELFGIESDVELYRLCGEIMHCMYAAVAKDGCGTSEHCPDCVVRNSVENCRKGKKTSRKKYKMKIKKNGKLSDVYMLITASPLAYENDQLVLLVIEDISEVILLKDLIPICSNCKKIRNDENYWEAVTDYLNKTADIEFTHGICPECRKKLYGEYEISDK